MWQIQLKNFLDKNGEIDPTHHESTQCMIHFMVATVAQVTPLPRAVQHTLEQGCYRVTCPGKIMAKWDIDIINWQCNDCQNGGVITEWQGTAWDQSK